MDFTNKILIWTDGACSGNPGPGGWGSIVVLPEGQVRELGGKDQATTNNRMEMTAVICALESVSQRPEEVMVLTDSTYVIRGITQWIWGWMKRDWKNAEGGEVSNQDLWKELNRLVRARKSKIHWHYVRGHSGIEANERVDQIAVAFTQSGRSDLYKGSLIKYPYAVYDLPEDTSLPEMKSGSEKKKKAYSYLSYVNGSLERHNTWPECEARVKGRPGAKFKKSASASDEIEIIKAWGLSEDALTKK